MSFVQARKMLLVDFLPFIIRKLRQRGEKKFRYALESRWHSHSSRLRSTLDTLSCTLSSSGTHTAREGLCNKFCREHRKHIHRSGTLIVVCGERPPVDFKIREGNHRNPTSKTAFTASSSQGGTKSVLWIIEGGMKRTTEMHGDLLARFWLRECLVEGIPGLVVEKPAVHSISTNPIISTAKRAIVSELDSIDKFYESLNHKETNEMKIRTIFRAITTV
jgi:hypothetical protein